MFLLMLVKWLFITILRPLSDQVESVSTEDL